MRILQNPTRLRFILPLVYICLISACSIAYRIQETSSATPKPISLDEPRATKISPPIKRTPIKTSTPPENPQLPATPIDTRSCKEIYERDGVTWKSSTYPDPHELAWQVTEIPPFGNVRIIPDLPTYRIDFPSTPYEDSALALFGEGMLDDLGPRFNHALVMLDLKGTANWEAARYTLDLQNLQLWEWLPEGRLLWNDEGTITIAQIDGTEKRSLFNADLYAEVIHIQDELALVGDSRILNVETGTWHDLYEGGLSQSGLYQDKVWSERLHLAPDRKTAAYITAGEIWKIPILESGQPTYLTTIDYPGRGGRIAPVTPLADSVHWVIREQVLEYPGETVLVNSQTGELIPFAHFAPDTPSIRSISPGGEWIVPLSWDHLILRRSKDMQIEASFEGHFGRLAWLGQPAVLYTFDETGQSKSLVRFDPQSGDFERLIEGIPKDFPISTRLQVSQDLIYLLIWDSSKDPIEGTLDVYSPTGEPIAHFPLERTLQFTFIPVGSTSILAHQVQFTQKPSGGCEFSSNLLLLELKHLVQN